MKENIVYVVADKEYWKNFKEHYHPLFNVTNFEFTDKVSLRTVLFNSNALFFFPLDKYKKKFFFIHLFAKILHKIYKHKNERLLYEFFKTNFDISKNLFIAHGSVILPLIASHFPFRITSKFYFTTINSYILYPKWLYEKIKFNLLNEIDGFYVSPCFYGNIFIINAFEYEYLSLIRLKFPNARIYVKFVDMVVEGDALNLYEKYCDEHNELISTIKDSFKKSRSIVDGFYTYSRVDAKLFNLIYEPNGVDFDKYKNISNSPNDYIFFAGKCEDQKRVESIYKLCNQLIECNLPFKFILVNLSDDYKKLFQLLDIDKEKQSISFEKIPYHELLNLTYNSSVLIDLFRLTPDEGYSYRISEALAMNKKIISNRIGLAKEDFYSPAMILMDENLDFNKDELAAFYNAKEAKYDPDKIKMFDTKNQILSSLASNC